MTAPTTRETADHAELAGVIKYLRREAATNKAKRSGQAHGAHFVTRARKLNQSADALENLLSEIAALRGERDGFCPDGAELPTWPELAAYWKDRATQAERQRDELRKALELAAKRFETLRDLTDHVPHRIACSTWADEARQANQGADQ